MGDPGFLFLFLIAAFAVFAVAGWFNARRETAALRERLKRSYGRLPERKYTPEETARIPRYFEEHIPEDIRSGFPADQTEMKDLSACFAIDDITANDLDLWSLFARINYCRSAAGEEVLYHLLRTPCYDEEILKKRELEIDRLSEEALRVDLQMSYSRLGGSGKYSVYDYLALLKQVEKRSNLIHYLGAALWLASLILLFVEFSFGFLALLVISGFQIITYYRVKGEADAYLSTFAYILRLIDCGDAVSRTLSATAERQSDFSDKLTGIRSQLTALNAFRKGAGFLVNSSRMNGSGNPLDIVADYLRMLLHIDLIKFNQMLREAGSHEGEIDGLITILGALEAEISVACFRASLKPRPDGSRGLCIPEFLPDHAEGEADGTTPLSLEVRDLTHVLLGEGAVPNSIQVSRGVLLTGSNASGKSTWLKALGLSAVMAQTIHTVTAASYRAPLCRIYSSMALSDDLQGGESYYVVEIRALSRVLSAACLKQAPPVLCFIDEVLRGTNTVERIAASTQILKQFTREPALVFAATHDLELAELLKDSYDNYHFEGVLTEEDVRFDYRLKEGPSETRNAIGLLRRFSYDPEITEQAEAMAERFIRTGEWTL